MYFVCPLLFGWRECSQGRQEGSVLIVDIPAELDRTVLVSPGSPVKQVDRYRFRQPYAAVHRLVQLAQDCFAIPVWILLKQIHGQLNRLLDPDASMTEVSLRLLEQRARRGVVKIDVELIGKHELNAAERILGTGVLTKSVWKTSLGYA